MKIISYSIVFSCLLMPFQTESQVNLQQGIVAAFPMNGNANDESANENDCDLPTGITLTEDRFGNPEGALLFDGSSYLECGSANALDDLYLPVSLSFWYKVEVENIGQFLPILFTDDNNGNAGNYYGFFSFFQNQKFWFGYGDGTGALIDDRKGLFSDSLIIPGTWTNIIGTIDESKNIELYINGINAAGTPSGNSSLNIMHNANYPMRIGLRSRYGPTYFKGKLDETYLWNRVLTSDEIQAILNGELTTKTKDLDNTRLFIYPNPSKNELFVEGLDNLTQSEVIVQIIDFQGRVISSTTNLPIHTSKINVSALPTGRYAIRFFNEDFLASDLIIISD